VKNVLIEMKVKIILRKRSVIKIVNDELNNLCQLKHSKHKSIDKIITILTSGLITYSFFQKSLRLKIKLSKSPNFKIESSFISLISSILIWKGGCTTVAFFSYKGNIIYNP